MKTKFISKYGQPITGAATNMKSIPPSGADGTTAQAMNQIKNAPRPFGNPHLNPMQASGQVSAVTQQQRRQFAGTHASGVKPRHWSAAQAHSDPPGRAAGNRAVGYAENYQSDYNPSTHPVAKAKAKTRVMRGAIPGAKPLIDNSDLFSDESIRNWNKNARGL